MPRSLATLTIAFGLVAIPVKLYSATQRSTKLRFRWMTAKGEPVRQELVPDPAFDPAEEAAAGPDPASQEPAPLPRALFSVPLPGHGSARGSDRTDPAQDDAPDRRPPGAARAWADLGDDTAAEAPAPAAEPRPQAMSRSSLSKALELAPGQFVLFTPAELQALETPRRDSIDLVSFVPPDAVDPIYVDKSYFLAPAARAERPYALLVRALQQSRCCALARWAWRGGEHPALMRPWDGVLVLHQLHAGDTVRTPDQFDVPSTEVSDAELELAMRLVASAAQADFDPMAYVDPARQRILDAAHRKLAGGQVIQQRQRAEPAMPTGGNVVDLMAALKASLKGTAAPARRPARPAAPMDRASAVRRRG